MFGNAIRQPFRLRRADLAAVALAGFVICSAAGGPLHWIGSAAAETPARDFTDVTARVRPAVVGVRATITRAPDEEALVALLGVPADRPRGSRMPKERERSTVPVSRAAINQGSGFFISSDGYVVTTNHVIEGSHRIEITTDDERTYPARIAGVDPRSDVALLKVDAPRAFPFVRFADHAPRIGEWVLAVGYPFGLGGTVTAGIVSARAREVMTDPDTDTDFLQIDAAVNQGNSGGPAFDLKGDVVGMNSAIFSPSGGSIGIGFAVPAATVDSVVGKLKQRGVVVRGWIGVRVQAVTDEIAEGLGATGTAGALVIDAQPNGPAAQAGIASGDLIKSVNGVAIEHHRELTSRISELAPGTPVRLDVVRGGEQKTVTVALGEMPGMPRSPAPAAATPVMPGDVGLGLAANRLGGVLVTDVDPAGTAAQRGLAIGDIILGIGAEPVRTPADIHRVLAEARDRGKRFAVLRVTSKGGTSFVAVAIR